MSDDFLASMRAMAQLEENGFQMEPIIGKPEAKDGEEVDQADRLEGFRYTRILGDPEIGTIDQVVVIDEDTCSAIRAQGDKQVFGEHGSVIDVVAKVMDWPGPNFPSDIP